MKALIPLAPGRLAGTRENYVEIGDAAIRYPGLLAIEHVVAAVGSCGATHGGDVGTGRGLRESKCRDRLTARNARQVACFLLVGASQTDGTGTEPLHGKRKVGETGMARQRLADQTDRARVDGIRGATPFATSDGIAQPTVRAQSTHQRAAFLIDIMAVVLRHGAFGPCIEGQRQLTVTRFKKGPIEVADIAHVSSLSVAFECRLAAIDESLIGALEILGEHA